MQGRTIINRYDNGGWAVYKTRRWGERDFKSERQKGIRKRLNRQIRRKIKHEFKQNIEEIIC